MNLLQNDTALGRGIRTAIQAMVGFIVGLFVTIWAVPGVPDAILSYVRDNLLSVLLTIGVPSGLAGYAWNAFLRKDVKNY